LIWLAIQVIRWIKLISVGLFSFISFNFFLYC
jgi:hypothetical protein